MKKLKIACIILTVDNYSLLEKSITSLLACRYSNLSISVFDNGSKQPIKKWLKKDFPKVEYVRSKKNLGFAEGNNRAISHILKTSNPDYFLLFNNDAVANEKLFKECLPHLENRVGLLCPAIMLSGRRGIDNVGIDYYRSGYSFNRLDLGNKAELVSGCCLFVSVGFAKSSFVKFGWLFNPMFFSYGEDLELGLRAKLLGGRTKVLDKYLVVHGRLGTLGEGSKFQEYMAWRNLLWTIITTWPAEDIFRNLWFIIWGQITVSVIYLWDGNPFLFPRVYISTFKYIPKLVRIRKKVQSAYKEKMGSLDDIFVGNIANWDMFLKDRKILRIGKYLRRFFTLV